MKKSMVIFFVGILTLVSMEAQATPISILNPSFETNQPADGGWISNPLLGDFIRNTIDNWTINGTQQFDAGTWQPTKVPYPPGVPGGLNVAYINDYCIIYQIFTEVLAPNSRYTLQVFVGKRGDRSGGINYAVQLYAGGLLAEDTSLYPMPGEFLLSTLTYDVSTTDHYIGNPLEIRLLNLGVKQVSFDMVNLDFIPTTVPEPATLLLLGSGLVGRVGFRRRFKKQTQQIFGGVKAGFDIGPAFLLTSAMK